MFGCHYQQVLCSLAIINKFYARSPLSTSFMLAGHYQQVLCSFAIINKFYARWPLSASFMLVSHYQQVLCSLSIINKFYARFPLSTSFMLARLYQLVLWCLSSLLNLHGRPWMFFFSFLPAWRPMGYKFRKFQNVNLAVTENISVRLFNIFRAHTVIWGRL